MRYLSVLFAGVLIGIAGACGITVKSAPDLMIVENVSPLSQADTVAAIKEEAEKRGWKVPTVHHLHKSLAKKGFVVPNVSVLALCQPEHAAKILLDDTARVVTSMMPCRISVYETSDGEVIMSRMNSGLMSRMFPKTVSKVMIQATSETESIVQAVLDRG